MVLQAQSHAVMRKQHMLAHYALGSPISLGDIHNMPTRSKFVYFQGFLRFSSRAPKFHSVGGVCVYFLKSVRKGHFRNAWVRGG